MYKSELILMAGWQEDYHHWLVHVFGKQPHKRLLNVDSYKSYQTEESINMAIEMKSTILKSQ